SIGLKIVGTGTAPTAGTFEKLIDAQDSSGVSLFELRDLSNANNNFGAAATSGAFISRNSYWGEEFNVFRTTWAAGITTTINDDRCRGDQGSSFTATTCTVGTGEMSFSAVLGAAGGTATCNATSNASPNGFEKIL